MDKKMEIIIKMPVGNTGQTFEFTPDVNDNDMVNITDLWKKFGSIENKEPAKWSRQDDAKEFIDKLCKKLNVLQKHIYRGTRGRDGATFAHWQIAWKYVKYLSPETEMVCNQIVKERIEEEINPELAIERGVARGRKAYRAMGKTDEWIDQRIRGKLNRDAFTRKLSEHGVRDSGYGYVTNMVYQPLLGGKAAEVKHARGLAKSDQLRDHLNPIELAAVALVEEVAAKKITDECVWGHRPCGTITELVSKATKRTLDALLGDSEG